MVRLYCEFDDLPTVFSTLLFNQLPTLNSDGVHKHSLTPLGCLHQMIHNQVDPLFVSLITKFTGCIVKIVVFHVDSMTQFDNLSNCHFWLKPGTLSSTATKVAWLSRRLKP